MRCRLQTINVDEIIVFKRLAKDGTDSSSVFSSAGKLFHVTGPPDRRPQNFD